MPKEDPKEDPKQEPKQDLGTSHLEQKELIKECMDEITEFATWVAPLKFEESQGAAEILKHEERKKRIMPLLTKLGLQKKTWLIMKIPGPKPLSITDSRGSSYAIPIHTIDASQPTISGRPFVPGTVTRITDKVDRVEITPKVIYLNVMD